MIFHLLRILVIGGHFGIIGLLLGVKTNWMDVWNQRHQDNPTAATGEAARRYFSAKENILSGAETCSQNLKESMMTSSLMILAFQVISGIPMIINP